MESFLYKKLDNNAVQCLTCSHYCRIQPGKRGLCGVRENKDGMLDFLTFDKVIAASVDPIEKKPMYHFMPGTRSYSVATVGCNFACDFCQNADIAQMPKDRNGMLKGMPVSPNTMVVQAVEKACQSISYTYTEPTIFFELAYETGRLAKEKGLFNIFVSNGYMSSEALNKLDGILDAANIDLKSFDPEFYRKYCQAKLEPVKQNLVQMKKMGILVEITTLLIPGLNDDPEQLNQMARFIANELGEETPWHISRFHPTYQMTDRPVTPVESLEKAYDAGVKAGLHYVYLGNLPGHESESTRCHGCGAMLVERSGYQVKNRILSQEDHTGQCPDCDQPVYGIF